MKVSIITLFPEMFVGPLTESILKNAQAKKLLSLELVDIRTFGIGKHEIVDDTPYGGGVGMVLRVDVVHQAIKSALDETIPNTQRKIILTSAQGQQFTQEKANKYAQLNQLIIVCGHYEGIDSRIREYIDEEISIGDFVTTGGEIPAMLITDAVVRRIKGVLKDDATLQESFQKNIATQTRLLEHPHFTKPAEYNGSTVPEVLLSGDHKKIAEWRLNQAVNETRQKRPDLLKND